MKIVVLKFGGTSVGTVDRIKKVAKIIKDEMTSVKDSDLHSFSTPLTVDLNIGDNWGLLH